MGNMRDYVFVEGLRVKMNVVVMLVLEGGRRRGNFLGIKWDDVISEWVVVMFGMVGGKKGVGCGLMVV